MFRRRYTKRTLLVDGAMVDFIVSEKAFRRTLRLSWIFLIAGALLMLYPLTQRAHTSVFHPSVCLGDWEQAAAAAGEPDGIRTDGSGAAVLAKQGADIFCSSFSGSAPTDAVIERVYLRFSWHVGNLEDLEEPAPNEGNTGSVEEEVSSEEPDAEAVSEEENGTEIIEDAVVSEEDATGEEPENTVTDTEPVPEPETALPEDAAEPEEPTEPETPTAEGDSAFLGRLFAYIARAEAQEIELVPEIQEPPSNESTEPVEDVVVTQEAPGETNEEVSDTTVEEEIETVAEPVTNSVEPLAVRVSYTLDGTSWEELGVVMSDSWQNTTLAVPIANWEEIGNLQILIQGAEDAVFVPVYLDALSLSILYQRTDMLSPEELFLAEEEPPPYVPPYAPPYVAEGVRVLTREINIDPEADHFCHTEPLSVVVSGTTTPVTRVILERVWDGPEELEIGSLPLGTDVVFAKTGGYDYRPKAEETTVDLHITTKPDAQEGNFSVPIIYTQDGRSTIVCQVNVIND